ncbi:MAG TPA: sulfatase-like hydrolase/transferase [Vicinamibacterales bacterium]|nr:sulfatase-like hydrolase/transferase [Vicinamibacterales bacterium]
MVSPTKPRSFRPALLAVGVALVAIIATGWWWWTGRPRGPGAVVLISIDTLRADRLPVYGYAAGSTPALSAFAGDAIVFDRAYAHAPQTLPSHTSIFTGRLPFEHKVRDNLGFTLPAGQTTLASLFSKAGYQSAGFVSAYVLRAETGMGQGFDQYDATLPPAASDQAPAQILRPGPATLDAATRWLGSRTDERFFLFFHIYEPHAPYTPPDRFPQPDRYDGEVAYADEIVGGLLTALRQKTWYDDATIVVTADHGEGLGDHTEREHGLFVYDETIRVPLMIKLPNGRHGGTRVAEPVQHIDLLPTLGALAGFAVPADLRGRNLQPVLMGTGSITPQGIYAEALYPRYHFGWSELVALVDGRYKYIKAPRPELFDLERDPHERQNVVEERAQASLAMRAALDMLVAGQPIDSPSAVSGEDRERLAALGYVGTQTAAPAAASAETLPDPKDKVGILVKYREAIERMGAGKFDEGLRLLREVLDDNPDMIDAWMHYAAMNIRLGRLPDAYQAYRQVIQRKPDEPAGLLGASSVLLSMNRYHEARQHAELALKRSPAGAHQALANVALMQGRFNDALRHANLVAEADPTLPFPMLVRGTIEYNGHRYAEALPLLMAARDGYSRRTTQPSDLNFFIGDSLARLGRYEEALPYFVQELRLYPQNTRARAGMAMLYQSVGRPADAERVIQDMLRSSPNPEAYDRAENLWRMFGRSDRAAAVRAEAAKRFGR